MEKIYSRKRFVIPRFSVSILRKNNKKKHNEKYNRFIYFCCIILIMILTLNRILNIINPIIQTQCEIVAKNVATKIANEKASEVMSKYNYDDLCNVVKDSEGKISILSANVVTVNEIISDITLKIEKEFEKNIDTNLEFRLGNLTGIKIFSGSGPNIRFKIEGIGNIDTELKSEFESQGINQTLHKMYLQIECNVSILTPYNIINEKITNQILLTEAIIIGITPDMCLFKDIY